MKTGIYKKEEHSFTMHLTSLSAVEKDVNLEILLKTHITYCPLKCDPRT
jgi:hypothetical protein